MNDMCFEEQCVAVENWISGLVPGFFSIKSKNFAYWIVSDSRGWASPPPTPESIGIPELVELACRWNFGELLLKLVEQGHNYLLYEGEGLFRGMRPLCIASSCGSVEAMEILMTAGANPASKGTRRSFFPVHFAAYQGHIEAVKLLLSCDVDVNSKTSTGDTPLSLAMYMRKNVCSPWNCKYDTLIEFLVSKGASIQ